MSRDPYRLLPVYVKEDDWSWRLKGLCADEDPELFFPSERNELAQQPAKAICKSGCPVLRECRTYAMIHPEAVGVWGGLSEYERRRLRKGIPEHQLERIFGHAS